MGTVTATDEDAADTLTAVLSGADASSFDISATEDDGDTGSARLNIEIKTKSGVTYDYETKATYSVTVEVTDSGRGSASLPVTIKLTDVGPSFTEDAPVRTAPEGAPAVRNVGAPISVSTTGSGPLTAVLSSTVSGAADADAFTLTTTPTGDGKSASIQIATASGATFDYETKSSYAVTITVTDRGGEMASVPVTINVSDVGPVFAEAAPVVREVLEDTPAGQRVGAPISVSTTGNGPLTAALTGTDAGSFTISPTSSGAAAADNAMAIQLLTASGATFDYETKSSYSVTITVTDGDRETASAAVTINVMDQDESLPSVVPAPTVVWVTDTTARLTWGSPQGPATVTGCATSAATPRTRTTTAPGRQVSERRARPPTPSSASRLRPNSTFRCALRECQEGALQRVAPGPRPPL